MSIWSDPEGTRAKQVEEAAQPLIEVAIAINEHILEIRNDVLLDPDSDHNVHLIGYDESMHWDSLEKAARELGFTPDAVLDRLYDITKVDIRGDQYSYDETDVVFATFVEDYHDCIEADDVAYTMNMGDETAVRWTSAAIRIVQAHQLRLGGEQKFGITDAGDVEFNVGHWICRIWDRDCEAFKRMLALLRIPANVTRAQFENIGKPFEQVIFPELCYPPAAMQGGLLSKQHHPEDYFFVSRHIRSHWYRSGNSYTRPMEGK